MYENFKLFLLIENNSLDSFIFTQNSFSQAISNVDFNFRKYSANGSENPNGYIKINHFDEDSLTISGTFSFTGFSENRRVDIENGVFENVQLERQEGTFRDGKVSSVVDNRAIKHINTWITDSASYISLWTEHPTGHNFTLQVPKNVSVGINEITESNLGNREEIVFWYKQTINGLINYIPLETSNLEIDEFDFENKILKGNLTGKFTTGLEDTIDVTQFELDLNWK